VTEIKRDELSGIMTEVKDGDANLASRTAVFVEKSPITGKRAPNLAVGCYITSLLGEITGDARLLR